jgi:hypothetical protein
VRVELLPPLQPGTAFLLYIIPEGKKPPFDIVQRSYGENAPSGAYKPSPHTRLVFAREGSKRGNVVIPVVPRNARLWREISPIPSEE